MAIRREQILESLRTVYDPEVPINVVDLGLIYGIDVSDEGDVDVHMTMTAPQCPMSSYLLQAAEQAVRAVTGVREVKVELTFDPPWDPSMIKEDALKDLGVATDTPAKPDGENCLSDT